MPLARNLVGLVITLIVTCAAHAAQSGNKAYENDLTMCSLGVDADDIARAIATGSETNWEKNLVEKRTSILADRRACLQKLIQAHSSNKKNKANATSLLARSDVEYGREFEAARTAFFQSPVQYFREFLEEQDISKLEEMVEKARGVNLIPASCTRPDDSMPDTNTQLRAFNSAASAYEACMDNLEKQCSVDDDEEECISRLNGEKLGEALQIVRNLAPFDCSRYDEPGCLNGAAWTMFSRVATPSNAELVKRAESIETRRLSELEKERAWLSETVKQVEEYVQSENRRKARRR